MYSQPAWIDAFVMRLNALGCDCEPHVMVEIAEDNYLAHQAEDPSLTCERLVAEWGGVPQHD